MDFFLLVEFRKPYIALVNHNTILNTVFILFVTVSAKPWNIIVSAPDISRREISVLTFRHGNVLTNGTMNI